MSLLKILKTLGSAVALAGSAFVFSSCASSNGGGGFVKGQAHTSAPERAIELKALQYTNQARGANGAGPVAEHAGLTQLARQHSDFMMKNAGKFKLEGKKISHFASSARAAKAARTYQLQSISENVMAIWGGYQGDVAKEVIDSWMESKGHRFAMLGKAYNRVGIGIRKGEDGSYFATMLIALKAHSTDSAFGPRNW